MGRRMMTLSLVARIRVVIVLRVSLIRMSRVVFAGVSYEDGLLPDFVTPSSVCCTHVDTVSVIGASTN